MMVNENILEHALVEKALSGVKLGLIFRTVKAVNVSQANLF